jgi:hypothetical protein
VSEERDFNPQSIDAQLATVLARMSAQDALLQAIHTQTKLTNGRVSQHDKDLAKLELQMEGRWRYLVGGAFAISIMITALWAMFVHFTK